MTTTEISIEGMHCKSCKMLIEDSVGDIDGVSDVSVSWQEGNAKVTYDPNKTSLDEIGKVIKEDGYEVKSG